MQIKYAEYVASAVKPEQYPKPCLPAIVLLGRSNVGKSSLINTLANRKGLARISQHPGKTRTINFYLMNNEWYLTDLPGYGYAKVSKSERANWQRMIDTYLQQRQEDKFYWQLVDIRHAPSEQDKEMWQRLRRLGCRQLLIATKADKISRGAKSKNLAVICRDIQAAPEEIICYSAVSRDGKEELLAKIDEFLPNR